MRQPQSQSIFTARGVIWLVTILIPIFFAGITPVFTAGDCSKTYPNPVIRFAHKDEAGRIYISVVNWPDYPNEMFRRAPDPPPYRTNHNSSRTWVEIYNAATNTRICDFRTFSSNADLKNIWFKPGALKWRIYIIINDRACQKRYKSNTISW